MQTTHGKDVSRHEWVNEPAGNREGKCAKMKERLYLFRITPAKAMATV